jgi:tRNA(Ile2) C34 agmatinyltransferase TiaS
MTMFIGMDDTDNHESRGTGRLAREVAANLADRYGACVVTRHQLLVDPRIPYTSHNSSAALSIEEMGEANLAQLFEQVRGLMLSDFQPGSDPGLCVTTAEAASLLVDFGRKAQREVVTQSEARNLAEQYGVLLEGLGGTQDGVIGALAAAGLAASGEDGRYLLVGGSRELTGMLTVEAVHAAGLKEICKLDGSPVQEGMILADKLRPARRKGRPVLYVEWEQDHWAPLKLD